MKHELVYLKQSTICDSLKCRGGSRGTSNNCILCKTKNSNYLPRKTKL